MRLALVDICLDLGSFARAEGYLTDNAHRRGTTILGIGGVTASW